MNIQSTNVNFQGGFRFKNMPIEAKSKITEIAPKGKQVFENFENQNDVFLLIRDKYDKRVVNFIKKHKLNFEYTPLINTGSNMDTEKPELLSQLIKDLKPEFVSTIDELNKSITSRIKPKKVKTETIAISEDSPYKEQISNILKSLCIDSTLNIKAVKGVNIIEDKEFARKIYITKPSERNIHYIIVEPFSRNKNSERYAMDGSGNILCSYKSPEGIKSFDKKFSSLTSK